MDDPQFVKPLRRRNMLLAVDNPASIAYLQIIVSSVVLPGGLVWLCVIILRTIERVAKTQIEFTDKMTNAAADRNLSATTDATVEARVEKMLNCVREQQRVFLDSRDKTFEQQAKMVAALQGRASTNGDVGHIRALSDATKASTQLAAQVGELAAQLRDRDQSFRQLEQEHRMLSEEVMRLRTERAQGARDAPRRRAGGDT